MRVLLELDRVTCRFEGMLAVDNVSLVVEEGSIHGLIGPNGAGKTTLFNVVTGLVRPTQGRIRFRGTDITGLSPHRRARLGMGRVFQISQLFATLPVREHLILAGGTKAETAARPWIEALGLARWLDAYPSALPFGVRRLVELAMVLTTQASCLLLDEPVAGLSPPERANLAHLLRRMQDAGKTLVIVEHDLTWTLALVDRLTVLAQGQVIADGTPDTVAASPAVQAAYLGAENATAGGGTGYGA